MYGSMWASEEPMKRVQGRVWENFVRLHLFLGGLFPHLVSFWWSALFFVYQCFSPTSLRSSLSWVTVLTVQCRPFIQPNCMLAGLKKIHAESQLRSARIKIFFFIYIFMFHCVIVLARTTFFLLESFSFLPTPMRHSIIINYRCFLAEFHCIWCALRLVCSSYGIRLIMSKIQMFC